MNIAAAAALPAPGPLRESRAAPSPMSVPLTDATLTLHGLSCIVDEVGHGLLLVDADEAVVHANRAALAQLRGEHPLEIRAGRLRARGAADADALACALEGARRQRRRLLMLGRGATRLGVNVVPLAGTGLTMVALGRRQVGDRLAIECFAQAHRLTAAETQVLQALCAGVEPAGIAAMMGKGLSTVRTQISHVREKTGARDITELMRQVAQLPTMACLHAVVEERPAAWNWSAGCAMQA